MVLEGGTSSELTGGVVTQSGRRDGEKSTPFVTSQKTACRTLVLTQAAVKTRVGTLTKQNASYEALTFSTPLLYYFPITLWG